jgi:hypothetical protein
MRALVFALLWLLMIPAAHAQNEDQAAIDFTTDTKPADFCKAVDHALLNGYFDELDATAKIALTLKNRLRGGETELAIFYRGLTEIDCVWDNVCAADPDVDRRLQRLQEWRDEEPGMATPKVALMRFWHVAAWAARGCGYANTVTPEQWDQFGQRLHTEMGYARQIKPEDDPEATRMLLELAQDVNVPRAQLDAIFAAGRKHFPTYFGIYSEYANLIQQKWSGRTDLAAPYLRSLLNDPDTDTGEVAYSFAAGTLLYATEGDNIYNNVTGLDWPTVRRAYATRERLYGLGPTEWALLCYFATVAGDREAARDAFHQVVGQLNYWPKVGAHDFYLYVLPWIMARNDGPTDGPSHGR